MYHSAFAPFSPFVRWREWSHSNSRNEFSLPFLLDSSLGGDFFAGLTVACILIPQSVSYGTSLAKLDPTAGLVCHAIHLVSKNLIIPSCRLHHIP